MAPKKKPQKSLLNEGTIRRMMKLADIPELSDSFIAETTKGERTESGELAYEDPSRGERITTGKHRGEIAYADPSKGEKITTGHTKGEEAYGSPSKGEHKKGGGLAYMEEESEEESELHATEDELGAEDEVADEEGAELDAEPATGEAEITPEAAQAIVDLAASLEASGALEGEAEAEEEVAVADIGGGEVEAEEEVEEIEEALTKLGIEVVDDRLINETVRKRVVARLLKEKKARDKERTINTLVDNIFARLQKRSK